MNTFKKGDMVDAYGSRFTVTYTDGPYVYGKDRSASYYADCTLVPQPKFKPGDVVRINTIPDAEYVIKKLKTDGYLSGRVAYEFNSWGWEFESNLTPVRPADDGIVDLLKAGKLIDAIKQHRIIYGTGLREAKEAVEKIRDGLIVAAAVAAPKFKVGDRVKHKRVARANDGIILEVFADRCKIQWNDFCIATDPFDTIEHFVSSSTPTIVARFENGKYQPNQFPRVHDTVELAKKEAECLAVANPGVSFATFTLASTSTATAPSVKTVAV